jgi:Family of unknown function (DUF5681)
MPFQPGVSGNPGGRTKDRPITDALRMEMAALANGEVIKHSKGSARQIAQAQLLKAGMGDSIAFEKVTDRLEGKVPQAIVGGADHPPVFGQYMEWLAWIKQDGIAIAGQTVERITIPAQLMLTISMA